MLQFISRPQKLTPNAYVCEQYMSPKKKSRNSTGKSPARSNRHCDKSVNSPWAIQRNTDVGPDEPESAAMVYKRQWIEQHQDRYTDKYYGPVNIETVVNEAAEVEPDGKTKTQPEETRDLSMLV